MESFSYDLPVYRLEQNKYYDDMDKYIKKKFASDDMITRKYYDRNRPQKELRKEALRNEYGGAWDFNEIIGYIRLYFYGAQVRGEYWKINAKRIVRSRKRFYIYKEWNIAAEVNIDIKSTNSVIYADICKYICRCKEELKNRFIDDQKFKTLGPFINWRQVFEAHHEKALNKS